MSRAPDLSLVLACYNEKPVFEGSIAHILRVLDASRLLYEIIFVDDKSSDNTAALIRKACKKYKKCKGIYHKKNTGRGRAVTDGMLTAKGKVVGYIDFDLEVSPVYIPEIVTKILRGDADMIIGKRVYRTTLGSLVREIISIGYQYLADSWLDTGKLDTESGYKFMNRKKFLPVLKKAKHPHWFWDTEIVVYARREGLRVIEIPVLFLRRFDKQSSVKIVKDSLDYVRSLWRFRKRLERDK